jgi:hypothetical protein
LTGALGNAVAGDVSPSAAEKEPAALGVGLEDNALQFFNDCLIDIVFIDDKGTELAWASWASRLKGGRREWHQKRVIMTIFLRSSQPPLRCKISQKLLGLI